MNTGLAALLYAMDPYRIRMVIGVLACLRYGFLGISKPKNVDNSTPIGSRYPDHYSARVQKSDVQKVIPVIRG